MKSFTIYVATVGILLQSYSVSGAVSFGSACSLTSDCETGVECMIPQYCVTAQKKGICACPQGKVYHANTCKTPTVLAADATCVASATHEVCGTNHLCYLSKCKANTTVATNAACSFPLKTCNKDNKELCLQGTCQVPKQLKVGDTCDLTKIGQLIEVLPFPGSGGVICSIADSTVKCSSSWQASADNTYCMRGSTQAALGATCSYDGDCSNWYPVNDPNHSQALCYLGKCECRNGYTPEGGKCVKVTMDKKCSMQSTTSTTCDDSVSNAYCTGTTKPYTCSCRTGYAKQEYKTHDPTKNAFMCVETGADMTIAAGQTCRISSSKTFAKFCDKNANLFCASCAGDTSDTCMKHPVTHSGSRSLSVTGGLLVMLLAALIF